LRDAELRTRWADGKERHLEPVLVLCDRKERLRRTPFDRQCAHLQTVVPESSHIVIAGYGLLLDCGILGAPPSEEWVTARHPQEPAF